MNSNAPSDQDLLLAWRAGDKAAAQVLYQRYQFDVRRRLQRLVHNDADAEELTQETFLRVFESKGLPLSFAAYLKVIARNAAFDALQDRKMRSTAAIEPSAPALQDSALEEIHDILNGLSTREQEILVMATKYSIAEIARRLGIPKGTVHSRLDAARRRARRLREDAK